MVILNTLLLVVFFLGDIVSSDLYELSLVLGELCLGDQALTPRDVVAVKAQYLWDFCDEILFIVLPVSAGVADKVKVSKHLAPFHLFA